MKNAEYIALQEKLYILPWHPGAGVCWGPLPEDRLSMCVGVCAYVNRGVCQHERPHLG